jgi:hypothetical protein
MASQVGKPATLSVDSRVIGRHNLAGSTLSLVDVRERRTVEESDSGEESFVDETPAAAGPQARPERTLCATIVSATRSDSGLLAWASGGEPAVRVLAGEFDALVAGDECGEPAPFKGGDATSRGAIRTLEGWRTCSGFTSTVVAAFLRPRDPFIF